MMLDNDIESVIRRLAFTIRSLMTKYPDGWVPWRKVAREQEGAEEFSEFLSGYAELEEWKHLFAAGSKVVKLTEAGIRFCECQQPTELSETEQIAQGVTEYAARLDRINLRVEGIASVARAGKKFVHAVSVQLNDENIPSETPVEFRPRDGSITHGKIVGLEPDGGILYVAFDCQITEISLPGILSIDRGFLLHQLAQRIRNLTEMPPLMEDLLHDANMCEISIGEQDSLEVANELTDLPVPWARFLWGPPGAGKTFAIAHLASSLMRSEPNEKILIVTPSNRATDVAAEQLVSRLEDLALEEIIDHRQILRFGYPRKPQILERPELLGPSGLDELNRRVKLLSTRIAQAEHEKRPDVDLAVLRAELLSIQEEIKGAVDEHVQNCPVVATTVTLAYMNTSPIADCEWDTVLVDEATMVTPAMCTFLASLARKRLLFAGDPRQLGPVYEEGRRATQRDFEWMGRDIFDKSGVAVGSGVSRKIMLYDPRLARITGQRRCAAEIWSRIEGYYPEVENLTKEENLLGLMDLPPCPGRSIVFLDTSNNGPRCEAEHHSWRNQFTADLAMEVASVIAAEAEKPLSIAIISPYRAQVRLLKKAIRQEQRAEITPFRAVSVESGTVHQFQGSDADVVIFDMVDGDGRQGLGKLLQGDIGLRLVNVAITRAKGKFIIIGDKAWCRRSMIRDDNPILWDLIMGDDEDEILLVQPLLSSPLDDEYLKLASPIEEALYSALKSCKELSGVIAQYNIQDNEGKVVSRADFAFPGVKYAVYCDGRQWHLREDRWQRDWRQRNKLTELGWSFSVFTGSQIYRNARECADQVAKTLHSRLRDVGKES